MGTFISDAVVTVKKGEGRFLKSGGQWIYDNEIQSIEGAYENGEILRVQDFDGFPLGYGFINDNSKIRIRMMSRWRKEEPDLAFLRQRVKDAWEYRKKVIDTSSCRLIFGEADWLPGFTVDKYEDVLVVESLALGIDRLKKILLQYLVEILAEDQVQVRAIYERSDAPVRKKEGMPRCKQLLYDQGDWLFSSAVAFPEEMPALPVDECAKREEMFDPHVEIVENGVRYRVDVRDGQKTGFFLDQKMNRLAMQRYCKDKKVLDCFTHMGTFALNAGIAGAADVTGLDISEFAVAQATANAKLNGLSDTVHFRQANVLDELPKLIEQGESYDVLILDPPAFTKSREATKNAIKGYREINIRGLKLVKDGGIFATCSCSHFMTEELLKKTVAEAARSAHKRLRQIEFRTQGPDHPILWGNTDSYYLKFMIFQVCEEK